MAAALLTLTGLSIGGLSLSLLLALLIVGDDKGSHVLIAVFSTMLNLLAHSMMMFYLIGKTKAVREAAAEGALDGDYAGRVARLRGPVFSRATLAMAVTMTAGIIGAPVDVRVMPSWPHAALAIAAVLLQFRAFAAEIAALTGSARVVNEVNARLASK
jgi:hypothetical protein